MPKALIVCLYGIFDRLLRCPTEMIGYRKYLEKVLEYAIDLASRDELSAIVLCGGVTNPMTSISEAESVEWFFSELRKTFRISVLLESSSKNTVQNIIRGMSLAKGLGCEESSMIVITDEPRAIKAQLVLIRAGKTKTEVIGFKRRDIHWKSNPMWQFLDGLKYFIFPWTFERDLNV